MQTEIVLPQTKPETEWVNGRALQKTSGTYIAKSRNPSLVTFLSILKQQIPQQVRASL